MKIVHVIETLARSGGGLPAAVKSLIKVQKSSGNEVFCVVTGATTTETHPDFPVIELGKNAHFFSRVAALVRLSASIFRHRVDVLHLHGVWIPFFVPLSLVCKLAGVDYVISPHGQLLTTILSADTPVTVAKKKVYEYLFVKLMLRGAKKIHAVSQNEVLELCLTKNYAKKTVMIPNVVDDVFFDPTSAHSVPADPRKNEFKDVLFVGRFDQRKGILDLIDAFVSAELPKNWRLRIVGPQDDRKFFKVMSERISLTKMDERIIIQEPIYGDARVNLYASCHVLCLPSYSEVTGLVNIEAALIGRPVITTPNTGLFEIEKHGGVLCNTGRDAIAAALEKVVEWTDGEYISRCHRIQAWARSDFGISTISSRWQTFYS